jgi:Holliday junction resolvase RusA-like endonuclease
MKTIILKGEPKSTGAIYKITCRGRFGSYYVSQQGKAVKQSYIKQTLSQWKDKPISENVYVNIRLYFGTKRKADIDNFNKLLLDSMTGIVWIDDSQIQKMTIEKFYDKLDPRIEIGIDIVA